MSELSKKTIVGLTGGIASGKTIVSNHLMKIGYPIIDTDVIVKELYQNDEFINGVSKVLNKEIIVDNQVDFKLIRECIFNDNSLKIKLEQYIHPIVKQEVLDRVEETNTNNVVFVVVPLLFEAKFDDICDYILIIMSNRNNVVKRVVNRDNIEEELAIKIIDSQMSNKDKLEKGLSNEKILIIENNDSIEDLIDEVDEYILRFKEKRK